MVAMTLKEAIHICEEQQKWRRFQPPYDSPIPEHRVMPYSAKAYGEALDILITYSKNTPCNETDNYNYD